MPVLSFSIKVNMQQRISAPVDFLVNRGANALKHSLEGKLAVALCGCASNISGDERVSCCLIDLHFLPQLQVQD